MIVALSIIVVGLIIATKGLILFCILGLLLFVDTSLLIMRGIHFYVTQKKAVATGNSLVPIDSFRDESLVSVYKKFEDSKEERETNRYNELAACYSHFGPQSRQFVKIYEEKNSIPKEKSILYTNGRTG